MANSSNFIWINNQKLFIEDIDKRSKSTTLSWEKEIYDFVLEWFNENNYIVTKTSGSTGEPKEIHTPKSMMRASAKTTADFFNFKPQQTALMCLPAKYIAGKMMLIRAIEFELNLICIAPTIKLQIPQREIDFAAMIPPQAQENIAELPKIKNLIIGGAPVSQQLKNELSQIGANIFSTYGMTETVSHVALQDLKSTRNTFTALPPVTFSKNEKNCLVITAPHLGIEQLVTHDIVTLFSETEFEWVGRLDNVINSGGKKIIAEKVEQELSKFITSPFFVSSKPHDKWGQQLLIVIENSDKLSVNHIKSKCKASSFDINPEQIIILPKFVRTTTGKINRKSTEALFS